VVERLAAGLLRRHVAELALDHARHRLVAGLLDLRDTEVGELHRAVVGNDDVVRADVAVDEAQRPSVGAGRVVRVVERLADLTTHVDGHRDRHLLALEARGVNDVGEILAVGELHHDEVVALFAHPEVEDLDDVREAQARGDARLLDEHLDELGIAGELREDLLHRVVANETLAADHPRPVDLGHAAGRVEVEDFQLAQTHRMSASLLVHARRPLGRRRRPIVRIDHGATPDVRASRRPPETTAAHLARLRCPGRVSFAPAVLRREWAPARGTTVDYPVPLRPPKTARRAGAVSSRGLAAEWQVALASAPLGAFMASDRSTPAAWETRAPRSSAAKR
jgi:hypothetical protein